MRFKELKQEIEIPYGIEASVEDNLIKIKIFKQDNKIILSAKNATKKEKTMMGTINSHINNLIKGVDRAFIYKLKICSGHFPMKVVIEGNNVLINNFLGEKIPRKAKIIPGWYLDSLKRWKRN